MAKRVHPISYFLPRRDQKRPLRVHQLRDMSAALELVPVLLAQGYEYGEPILNAPPAQPVRNPAATQPHAVDVSLVAAGDLLLQTTRPPLDDWSHGDRKQVDPGHTDLEARLFDTWRRVLRICARSHVEFAPSVSAQLPAEFEDRCGMKFREAPGATYKQLMNSDRGGWKQYRGAPRTALFLLRVDDVWKNGPGLLGAFGMDGISTLVWAYRLGRDLAHLLTEPGFVLAELHTGDVPERVTDLRWAHEWQIQILLRASV